MTMLGVDGEEMSDAILGTYLHELSQDDRRNLFKAEYIDCYDTTNRRMTTGLLQTLHYCMYGYRPYPEILSALLRVEATCQARLSPAFWAKFQCCKRYLLLQTVTRTPSPHRERRGRDTPEPDKRPTTCLLQRLLAFCG